MKLKKLLITIAEGAALFGAAGFSSAATLQNSACGGIASWSASKVYASAGNLVTYNSIQYKNNWWTQGNQPDKNSGAAGSGQPWTAVGTCGAAPTPTPAPSPVPSPTPTYTPTPVPSPTASPVPTPVPSPAPTGNYPIYPANISAYTAGTIVKGSDGKLYQCKPWPYSGWCSGAAWAYAPGSGTNWQDAWTLYGGSAPAPTPTPAPTASPVPNPTANPSPAPTPSPAGSVVFSGYKDVTINANWNTLVMSTTVGSSSITPLLNVLPSNVKVVTWAFATGECGSETWGGMNPSQFAAANITPYINANKGYIISTGGAAGVFSCSSNAGMKAFLDRYMSAKLVGIDFDMEGGQTQAQINSLVSQLVYAKSLYPNLRISFTLASLADSSGNHGGLNSLGDMTIRAAKAAGLDFYVNLMVMDYGATSQYNCVVAGGTCDMAQSAIQAANNLKYTYAIASNRIEVTPMIGDNDTRDETFTLANAKTLAQYVVNNNLAGYHYWSIDRDTPCSSGVNYASPVCNSSSGATAWSFSNAIAPYFP